MALDELDELDEALFGQSPASGAPTGRRRRLPTTEPTTPIGERRLILLVAVLAGVGGAVAGTSPAGWAPADVLLSAGFAVVVTLAGSRARRWTWVVAAGLAVAAAGEPLPVGLAGAGLGVAVGSVVVGRRRRVLGAVSVALTVQALLRLPGFGFTGATALVSAAAVIPLFVSAYVTAPRRVKARMRWGAYGAMAAFALGALVLVAGAALASIRVDRGIDDALAGLEAARKGDAAEAAERLDAAADRLGAANSLLTGPWMLPARILPVIGPQAAALEVSTAWGTEVASAAAEAAGEVDVETFQWSGGQLDLEPVVAAQEPLERTARSMEDAVSALDDLGPWVATPVADRIDEFRAELDEAHPDAVLAADLARLAPAILGAGGDRTYLVAFTTPAESRGLGGFMGNWAELSASDGEVSLTESGRASDLNNAPGADERRLEVTGDGGEDPDLADYVRRYQTSRPWEVLQDVTISPDGPTVSRVLEQLYPQAGGREVDGVIVVDPYALAALMEFTGPIEVEGLDRPLTAADAAEFLLVDQYLEFGDREERKDFLDDVSREVFERLTTGDLPDPEEFAETLAPLVRQGRLALHSIHPDEQELVGQLGATAALPPVGPADFLSVVTQNGSLNKIDVYLERSISYDVTVDPATGALEAVATVELTNAVPSLELPEAVIGSNDQGLPPGTNEVVFGLYTPLRLASAELDGERIGVGAADELDRRVYSARFEIPPGQTRTVQLHLEGEVGALDEYRLSYAPQPLVRSDDVDITVRLAPGYAFTDVGEMAVDLTATMATHTEPLEEDTVLRLAVEPG